MIEVASLARVGHMIVAATAVALLIGLASASSRAQAAGEPLLERLQLERILDDPSLAGALAGVSVRDAQTGEILYSHNGDLRLVPASNQKLLTATAALSILGSDYRFETRVLTDGVQKGKTLAGNLYLQGTGDPTMLASRYQELARAVARRGITRVDGRLIADDTWFDDVRLGEDWAWDNESSYAGAQVSALTVAPNGDYDAGTVIVEVAPGEAVGELAQVSLTPETGYVAIENRARTTESGTGESISIDRAHGTNTVVVEGHMPIGEDATRSWVAVWEPTGYAADVFLRALQSEGIWVAGAPLMGPTPHGAEMLAVTESMPLGELAVPFLKLSNNGHAEILVKTMGRASSGQGSWDAGLRAIEEYLATRGVETDTLLLRDGSGMSHLNLIPANQLTQLLYAVQDEPWFGTLYEALPVAGRAGQLVGGTLRFRMHGTPAAGRVRAKTGSLTAVTSLSGYVEDPHGERRFAFAVLLNNYLDEDVEEIEDRIAIRLAELASA